MLVLMRRWLSVVIALVIILGIGSIFTFLYLRTSKPDVTTTAEQPTTGYTTYTSTKTGYTFSFQVPVSWTVKESASKGDVASVVDDFYFSENGKNDLLTMGAVVSTKSAGYFNEESDVALKKAAMSRPSAVTSSVTSHELLNHKSLQVDGLDAVMNETKVSIKFPNEPTANSHDVQYSLLYKDLYVTVVTSSRVESDYPQKSKDCEHLFKSIKITR